MVMKAEEVICIASAKAALTEPWEVSGLMYDIPRMLLAQGLISVMPCRKIYLGGLSEFELGEEKEEF